MYSYLLFFHSITRWLVLVSLVYAIYRGFRGWSGKLAFGKEDNTLRHMTATIAHVQLILGLWLYSISPTIRYFYAHYNDAVHDREIRFFGMEHSLMMLTAIIVITIGSMVSKRKAIDQGKFRAMAVYYLIGLLIILMNIPWPFSPLVNRPYFRMF